MRNFIALASQFQRLKVGAGRIKVWGSKQCKFSYQKDSVPDPSIDCFNQCEYLPRENNSLSNKVDW